MSAVSFPYPILGVGDDYINAGFQVALRKPDCELTAGEVLEIPFSFDMNDQEIQKLIDAGKASYGFEVSCSATARRDVHLESEPQGQLSLNTSEVFGEVIIAPRIFVLEDVDSFSSPNFNPEFEDTKYTLAPGDFIAMAADQSINANFKTVKFQSALKILRIEAIDPWAYSCDVDGDHIIVSMGPKFHDFFTEARTDQVTAPFLIMSVFKDAILAALEILVKDDHESASIWSSALFQRLDALNLKLPEEPDLDHLNILAQRLLHDDWVKGVAGR